MKNTLVRLLFICLGLVSISFSHSLLANSHPDKDKDKSPDFSQYQNFTIKTLKVDVAEMLESRMILRADSFEYAINLAPKKSGKVAFSLSGIGYQSNFIIRDLFFRITITGYKNDEIIYPAINLDQVNKHVYRENNQLTFKSITGSIPVWFHENVDSIRLDYSNSHSIILPQYLGIHGLQIIEDFPVVQNPMIDPCKEGKNIMIAVDNSASVEKKDRKMIAHNLRQFVKNMNKQDDSTSLSFLECGTEIRSDTSSRQMKSLLEAIRKFKKAKNQNRDNTNSTNWSNEFEKASMANPDVLIFITDSWSNWKNGNSESIGSMYQDLRIATNMLKSNGTRLIFLTLEKNPDEDLIEMVSPLLNGDQTIEHFGPIEKDDNLHNMDLIALQDINELNNIRLENLFQCDKVPFTRESIYYPICQYINQDLLLVME